MTSRRPAVSTAALIGAAVFVSAAARAEPPRLGFPLDCDLGVTCFLQQLVDVDPGPEAQDFACGGQTYDGHQGTDIRVADLETLALGWEVLAAAPGTVRAVRDGIPDLGRAAMPAGQDCGNGVAITHSDGWETQYCHMAQGSIAVAAGDQVAEGTPLGRMGLSGNTEFPHLHITLRHDGTVIDPFDPTGTGSCGAGADPLWTDPLEAHLGGGILSAGFAPDIPDFDAIKAGTADADTLPARGGALVVWGFLYGTRAGDEVTLRVRGPGGAEIHQQTVTLDRAQAQMFRASGRRSPAAGWPAGSYTGEVIHRRDGAEIDRRTTEVQIE